MVEMTENVAETAMGAASKSMKKSRRSVSMTTVTGMMDRATNTSKTKVPEMMKGM